MASTATSDGTTKPVSVQLDEIPEGFSLHKENTTKILLPSTDEAFLNPVQEFNRDLSVACIRAWSEELDAAKEKKWRERIAGAGKRHGQGRKKAKSECLCDGIFVLGVVLKGTWML